MALKILHTSDWHLGASLYNVSRIEEHHRFLLWLLAQLSKNSTDVLLIAGDVFQNSQPSAEAQRLYFWFLAQASQIKTLQKVIVIGGNHDAAARLDAPREVLAALGVKVVGGIGSHESSWERCLTPIIGADGAVELIVLAVPFVHEFRLGVRTTQRSPEEIQRDFREASANLYTTLVNMAEEKWPGVPCIATGHLTCIGVIESDFHTRIHQWTGSEDGLAPEVFDSRIEYVALGHIHRAYAVDADSKRPRVWYSGSPIALNIDEVEPARCVLMLDFNGDAPAMERIDIQRQQIPRWRDLRVLEGTPDEVSTMLAELTWESDLPPLLYVDLTVERYQPDLQQMLVDTLKLHPSTSKPRLVRVRQHAVEQTAVDEPVNFSGLILKDLNPETVFVRLHQTFREGRDPKDDLLTAFRSLLQPDEVDTTEIPDSAA